MRYRPEIDGLRAIAVLPVILFHAEVAGFSGGYVGVDVFFVISGYLITSIIAKQSLARNFSLMRFYERRARRILPALFFVALFCIPWAWMLMRPSQMEDFSQSLLAILGFVSNVLFWQESGYFAATAIEKPLLHTWSLAVEEQFYVFFPVFVILVWRLGLRYLTAGIIIIALLSLGIAEYGVRFHPSANFYLAPSRAWELMLGALCALYLLKREQPKSNWIAALGLLLIGYSIFAFDGDTPFPSVYALVPVVGTCLVILFGNAETLVARLLSLPAVVAVGLISYSAYLWHQPLFAFARLAYVETPPLGLMLALSVASLGLAAFSWRVVEAPFRDIDGKQLSNGRSLLIALLVAGVIFTVGLLGVLTSGYKNAWLSTLTPEQTELYHVIAQSKSNEGQGLESGENNCHIKVSAFSASFDSRAERCFEKYGPALVVLGDSHSIALYYAVAAYSDKPFVIGAVHGGCRPTAKLNHACQYGRFADWIASNKTMVRQVIFEQAGFYLLQDAEGETTTRSSFKVKNQPIYEPYDERVQVTLSYLETVAEHVPTLWLGPYLEPHIDAWSMLKTGCSPTKLALAPNQITTFKQLDKYIEKSVANAHAGIKYASQMNLLNFDITQDFTDCKNVHWADGDHWSVAGVKRFGPGLVEALISRVDSPS